MDSIGLDLQTLINAGLLQVHATCPMASGLGMHLASMDKLIDEYEPEVVIIDLISNLINTSDALDARSILTQLIDYLKTKIITTVCTSLLGHDSLESRGTQRVSSLVDTWINLRFFGGDNERKLGRSMVKPRGR
jgi:circadian clock protein KaiC